MKKDKIIESEPTTVWSTPFYGEIEYEMPKAYAKQLLATRKGDDQHSNPQKFLCDIVNTEFRIKGYCTRVVLV